MDVASSSTTNTEGRDSKAGLWPYYLLFFLSGFPALLYQIVWQRALFTLYGVNVESVTVVVTVFMVGLGLGSLVGGKLSTLKSGSALRLFGAIELSIGVFGANSLNLFRWTAEFTAGKSLSTTLLSSICLLLIPTLLMGSTLPILVAYLVRRTANVGGSVGALYAANTLGSGIACLCAAGFLMRLCGESGVLRWAALLNILVGGTAILASALTRADKREASFAAAPDEDMTPTISLATGMALAGASGFVALAYEIVWYRLYSFASGGHAQSFAYLLGFYLIGIAYGAFSVHENCGRGTGGKRGQLLRAAAFIGLLGSSLAYLVGPVLSYVLGRVPFGLEGSFCLLSIVAALLGAIFPILAEETIGPNSQAGRSLSYLYLSNILGSALGSFLIGFVVFDHWSLRWSSVSLLAIGTGVSMVFALLARRRRILFFAAGICVVLFLLSGPLYADIYGRLLFRGNGSSSKQIVSLVENRSGVIAVDTDRTVYGGGVYDGHFNIDPKEDNNGIFRCYAIAALHPHPARVLVIGLSSGSWAQVLAHMPGVEDMTIVEINPGYLPLIGQVPAVKSLEENPKVHIVIDDGRRWLVAHPNDRFDFILMNTTFHWRAHVSNLLSVEFLGLLRNHLAVGGVAYYNTTGSGRVQFTGAETFPYALRVGNFLAVSDRPIVFDRGRYRSVLVNMQIDGKPVFDPGLQSDRAIVDAMQAIPQTDGEGGADGVSIEDRASLLRRLQGRRPITDDNMGEEWN